MSRRPCHAISESFTARLTAILQFNEHYKRAEQPDIQPDARLGLEDAGDGSSDGANAGF